MRHLALFLAISASLPAAAQETFDLAEAVATCAECHGEDGVPKEAEFPIIWGQQFFYIYTQLKDYAAGRRAGEIMSPIASQYTREQQSAIAEHFAGKSWPKIVAHAEEGDGSDDFTSERAEEPREAEQGPSEVTRSLTSSGIMEDNLDLNAEESSDSASQKP